MEDTLATVLTATLDEEVRRDRRFTETLADHGTPAHLERDAGRLVVVAVVHTFEPGWQPRERTFPFVGESELLDAPKPDLERCRSCGRLLGAVVHGDWPREADDPDLERYLEHQMARRWRARRSR